MFQLVQQQPQMQSIMVDGQELFIQNMPNNQFAGAQSVSIGGQQAFLTPSGQLIRAPTGMMPANLIQNMGQQVHLPGGLYNFLLNFFFIGLLFGTFVYIFYVWSMVLT